MSALSLRLPISLHGQIRDLAQKDQVSINQFITIAVAEKVAALMPLDYVEQRAQRASHKKFDAVLDKAAHTDLELLPEDRMPIIEVADI